MRITALAGGVGGARFLRGLLHHLERTGRTADLTVIGNTADDITLHGLRVCPDLDTVMYTLGGGIHPGQGWGRDEERFTVAEEFAAYHDGPSWFTLGDRDLATHVVRTRMLGQGLTLSQVTAALCERWRPGVRLLPMSDDRIETHVVIDDLADGGDPADRADLAGARPAAPERAGQADREDAAPSAQDARPTRAVHFQEWWVRLHAAVPARRILAIGIERSSPAPGVLDALREADVVLLPPSNPVVSIGTILGVPGIRDALRGTRAPVVGVSPIIAGAPVRGMADACLTAIGVETTAAAVAGLYADFLSGWLVDDADAAPTGPAGTTPDTERPGTVRSGTVRSGAGRPGDPAIRARPLLMTDVEASADIAAAALDLALELRSPASADR